MDDFVSKLFPEEFTGRVNSQYSTGLLFPTGNIHSLNESSFSMPNLKKEPVTFQEQPVRSNFETSTPHGTFVPDSRFQPVRGDSFLVPPSYTQPTVLYLRCCRNSSQKVLFGIMTSFIMYFRSSHFVGRLSIAY